MRWLLLLSLPLLTACPPDLCDRGCAAQIEQCGEELIDYDACVADCTTAADWRTSYVDCLEAANSCGQIGLCPR